MACATHCWKATAEVLSHMPAVYQRLLAVHVDAGYGRCRACTRGGTGVPHVPWPCPMHRIATAARGLHHRRVGGEHLRGRPG